LQTFETAIRRRTDYSTDLLGYFVTLSVHVCLRHDRRDATTDRHGSGLTMNWVGLGQVGSGWVGSGWVGSDRIKSGLAGSGWEGFDRVEFCRVGLGSMTA